MPNDLWTVKTAIEMFRPGTVVWRHVRLFPRLYGGFNLRAELDPLMPTTTENGTMLRVNAPGMFIGEPEAIVGAHWGIVAFIQGKLSVDWTHLIVEQAVQKDNGGYMILRQMGSLPVEEYCTLRASMAEAYLPLLGIAGQDPLKTIDLFDSFEVVVGGVRLLAAYDLDKQAFAYREIINSSGWVQ